MIDWTRRDHKDGTFWDARFERLTDELVEELFAKLGEDETQKRGTVLNLHWCDGYVELAVEPDQGDPWGNSYQIDIDEFWTAADLEDLDEMDRVLSALRDRGTEAMLKVVREHLPWVRVVRRYESTVFSEPDDVYELS